MIWEQQIAFCEGSQAGPISIYGEGRLIIYFPVNLYFVHQRKLWTSITKTSRIN